MIITLLCSCSKTRDHTGVMSDLGMVTLSLSLAEAATTAWSSTTTRQPSVSPGPRNWPHCLRHTTGRLRGAGGEGIVIRKFYEILEEIFSYRNKIIYTWAVNNEHFGNHQSFIFCNGKVPLAFHQNCTILPIGWTCFKLKIICQNTPSVETREYLCREFHKDFQYFNI